MLASIAQGHIDLADILFLVAFIVCCIVFVLRVMVGPPNRTVDGILMPAAIGLLALAWFVL